MIASFEVNKLLDSSGVTAMRKSGFGTEEKEKAGATGVGHSP